jgi:antirestriction protein
MKSIETRAAIYVGTYAKYNAGSLAGAWLELSDFSDKEAFLAACLELHSDEKEPELMFQDWEGVPTGMISECGIDAEVFDWLDLDPEAQELLAVFRDNVDSHGAIDQAREAFLGRSNSREDFAEELFGECYEIPRHLEPYIDWTRVARDLECDGYTFVWVRGEYFVFRC